MKNQVTKDALSIGIAVGIYGVSFGALAVTYGFSILETTLLSSLMFTGASQFAFIGVIGAGGGALAAIAVAALLGSRNTLYALSLTNVLKTKNFKKLLAAHLTIDESTGMSVKYRDDETKTKQA
ncbi:MAG: AzlC family ABC transporter permease, partial [Candidatus Nanopelagicales bacterium]